MIPAFNTSGVLPPYTGPSPGAPTAMAPYLTSMGEIAHALCTSQARVDLLRHLVAFRKALIAIGITGWQWIDGSFCEDVETTRGRPPGDIDLVTLLLRPTSASADPQWQAFVTANAALFTRPDVKATYHCDVHAIDVGLPAVHVLPQITYWFSLFTHQRSTFLWKGILIVPLASDDDAAIAYVDGLTFTP